MKLTRTNAILPFLRPVDFGSAASNDLIGLPVRFDGGTLLPWEPDVIPPAGVIIHADDELVSVAMHSGGLAGTVKVKLLEAVSRGDELYVAQNNNVNGYASAAGNSFTGATWLCAQALEAGVEGEMVEAVLFRPEPVTIV